MSPHTFELATTLMGAAAELAPVDPAPELAELEDAVVVEFEPQATKVRAVTAAPIPSTAALLRTRIIAISSASNQK
jgi:hypothetical protein